MRIQILEAQCSNATASKVRCVHSQSAAVYIRACLSLPMKMANGDLRQQLATMRQLLLDEELLDEQFIQLEELEAEGNPNFVEEVFSLYFRDSTKTLESVGQMLKKTPVEFDKVDRALHMLKGNSASVGANKVVNEVNRMRGLIEENSFESCNATYEQLKKEHDELKGKMEAYLQLLKQVEAAEKPRQGDDQGSASDTESS
ncbi:histidine-containing phosphotransfer protein 4-like [Syzygium oleosum]|uniref:histidine-containing phosphotransfer protein 4-like n=1 Tax=Syzygium oleosum TaxID=219896 RepID=UPI0011D2BB77|nr:histidine-containing phosphotransfer protein 4-like [Syzygium oleosum]